MVHGVVAVILGSRSMGRREGWLSRHRPSTRESCPPTRHPRPLLLRPFLSLRAEDNNSKKALRRQGSSTQRQVKRIGLDGKRPVPSCSLDCLLGRHRTAPLINLHCGLYLSYFDQ